MVLRLTQLWILACLIACSPKSKVAPELEIQPQPYVEFVSDGQIVRFDVEIARTESERNQGLMNRKTLAPNAGMLFIFEDEAPRSFWMKNTFIALDMIFLNSKGQVVGIVENAQPLTETVRQVASPSQFVLEINGQLSRQKGITVGSQMTFHNINTDTK